jgi:hypothetical protein
MLAGAGRGGGAAAVDERVCWRAWAGGQSYARWRLVACFVLFLVRGPGRGKGFRGREKPEERLSVLHSMIRMLKIFLNAS